jgi:hypothetical protein
METTLLGLALPNVLQKLKDMLTKKGFMVQTIQASNPVIVAHRKGNWLRRERHLVFEISSVESYVTRIDVTAVIKSEKNNRHAIESIEESFANQLCSFKQVINSPYGI